MVEEIGKIISIKKRRDQIRLTVHGQKVLDETQIGDSIAINGICVTVTDLSSTSFSADIMPETIHATTLKNLRTGDALNLERAMRADGRYGGHFMTGHVDGTGRIVSIHPKGNARYLNIQASPELCNTLVKKGSVAVDGTSLTVFYVDVQSFTLSLIPHTNAQTILGNKRIGDEVNIETDILQKYSQKEQKMEHTSVSGGPLTYQTLWENGFIS
ncbi:riboflavin synthase [Sporolactobacillus kofuensis]|uniref:Riboflavin synthase n=1 Tax=Sporolactobacillus kofuensis TaxID=269672 RepID=A0ABW1WCJ8_9BACL